MPKAADVVRRERAGRREVSRQITASFQDNFAPGLPARRTVVGSDVELVRIQCSLEDLKEVVMGAIAVDDQKTTDIPKSSGILIGSSYLPNPRMSVVIEVNVIDVLAIADLPSIPCEIG